MDNILLLICSLAVSVAKGYDYLVIRPSTGAAVCISDEAKFMHKVVFPNIALDGPVVSGDYHSSWTDDWETTQTEIELTSWLSLAHRTVVTNGSAHFKKLGTVRSSTFPLYALAQNTTLLIVRDEDWFGKKGVIVDIDHIDGETGVRSSSIRNCYALGTSEESCQLLENVDHSLFLLGSEMWVDLTLKWLRSPENNPEADIFYIKSNNKVLLDPYNMSSLKTGHPKPGFIFVRSDQQQALFKVPLGTNPGTVVGKLNYMRRNYTVGKERQLCVQVDCLAWDGNHGKYALTEASSGRVVQAGDFVTQLYETRLEFKSLAQGTYQLELINITAWVSSISTCPGTLEIITAPGNITGCSIFEEGQRNRVYFESDLLSDFPSDIGETVIAKVCTAMGVNETSSEKIKFCGRSGCSLATCP